MKKKTSFSFIDIFTVVVGTMVGVGIFFKNAGVLRDTQNIWLALIAWVVGCLSVVGLVVGFKEISSATAIRKEAGTLGKWSKLFVGTKMSRWVGIFMVFIYSPTFAMLLSYYAYLFFAQGLPFLPTGPWAFLTATIVLYAVLCFANGASYRFGPLFQNIGTAIKFVPLLLVVILGFANPAESGGGAFTGVVNGQPATWKIGTIFLALPGIFFALDSFLGGLPLQTEEEKKGDAFKATVYGVVITSIFYILFATAVGFGTTNGDLFAIFQKTFGQVGARILYVIIGISAYTVANGMLVSGLRNTKRLADDKDFLPIKQIQGITKDKRYPNQAKFMFIHGSAHALILFGSAFALGESFANVLDVWGNVATLFGFTIYAILIFAAWANRYRDGANKVKVEQVNHFWIALVSAFVVFTLVFINILKIIFTITTPEGGVGFQLLAYMIILTFIFVTLLASIVGWADNKKNEENM